MKRYFYCLALIGFAGVSTSYGMQLQTTEVDPIDALYKQGEQLQLAYHDETQFSKSVVVVQSSDTDGEVSSCGQVVKELFFVNKTRTFLTLSLSTAIACIMVLAVTTAN